MPSLANWKTEARLPIVSLACHDDFGMGLADVPVIFLLACVILHLGCMIVLSVGWLEGGPSALSSMHHKKKVAIRSSAWPTADGAKIRLLLYMAEYVPNGSDFAVRVQYMLDSRVQHDNYKYIQHVFVAHIAFGIPLCCTAEVFNGLFSHRPQPLAGLFLREGASTSVICTVLHSIL